jgi:hypothetical protein
MTVVVSFIQQTAQGVSQVRIRENITVPGTTAATLQDGESVVIGNAETSTVAVAFGNMQDVLVPAGAVSHPITPNVGDIISVKAAA